MVLLSAFFQLGFSSDALSLYQFYSPKQSRAGGYPTVIWCPCVREHKSTWKEEYGWFNAIFYAEQEKWQFLRLNLKRWKK